MRMCADEPLLTIEKLHVTYPGRGFRRPPTEVIKGVSLEIRRGEAVGLVGESGSGKTTLGRAVLGLAPVSAGRVVFDGRDISALSRSQRRTLATDLQVVFQDPYSSLNPHLRVEDILSEPLVAKGKKAGSGSRVRSLLDRVQLPADAGRRLAREFSGGQRQRIAIARALIMDPKLIICDEPTSALDLTTQAKVLDLLLEIQEESGVSYLFISHDLAVVRAMSHRVAVMLDGRIVEIGTSREITEAAQHPYTKRLLLAAPVADPTRQAERRHHRRLLEQEWRTAGERNSVASATSPKPPS